LKKRVSKKLKFAIKKYSDIVTPINKIAQEINLVLNNKKKEKYFESVILLYSFIENLIKWLAFVKKLWKLTEEEINHNKELTTNEVKKLINKYKKLSFSKTLHVAYEDSLIDRKLYKKLDKIREERNNLIHQYWLYKNCGNSLIMRKKAEKLAKVANQSVRIFNQLTEEIGVEEVYKIFLTNNAA